MIGISVSSDSIAYSVSLVLSLSPRNFMYAGYMTLLNVAYTKREVLSVPDTMK